ncbi:hypothetical protein ABI59_06445 [Acidobacteria bacterium Mor1]|nr:hypothetical protein ABI59_06445 [Acidobacteria bacterium Mor1]
MTADSNQSWDLEEVRRVLVAAVAKACPAWLAGDREDIVQGAMIRVVRILEQQGEENRIRSTSYLWRVGYTATISEIRRRRRQQEEPVDLDAAPEPVDPGTPDPERVSASREIGRGIEDCLLAMIEPRRLAVTLHLHGYGLKESAAMLGWDVKRVDNLLYRGLGDLRKCLSGKGLEP